MKQYPLKISYIAKSAIWSGRRLAAEWGKIGESDRIAETWELSVRPKEMAVIQNGEAAGMTLAAYFSACGARCVSPAYRLEDRFPLLIKLIDAEDRLSVQVHPDDAYAARVESDSGKTEMWHIVEAAPDATIVYGLREGIDRVGFSKAVAEGQIGSALQSLPVKAGETYFIPAGMVHAIGKGILIAEIQQNSDLTYRIYDYDRRQKDGTLRELHTEKAMDVVRPFTEKEIDAIRFAKGRTDDAMLANSPYFRVYRRELSLKDGVFEGRVGKESFSSLLCIGGLGVLIYEGEAYPIARGDSYFLPAGMGDYRIEGDLTWLVSEL